jgi:hypothetical protein
MEIEEDCCIELNTVILIKEKGRDGRIAIVGHFPFISKVHKIAKEVWVVEKNKKLAISLRLR